MRRVLFAAALVAVALIAAASLLITSAEASLTETQGATAVMDFTAGDAARSFLGIFQPWGIRPCYTGDSVCWGPQWSTWSDPNQTGPNTIWVTANHFTLTSGLDPQQYWRDRYRAKAYRSASSGPVAVTDKSHIDLVRLLP